ncbi:hypothetical protein ABIF38_002555 [Bradyrhizobium japonicum]|uniref:Uncharacterized protein n=1 Tax=Bradyrhizobium elkanii TaxID=29448 RepID=A0ABV4FE21_BRAEL|nr:hypothetical protein [Bradyrhizobium elkanii]MBP2431794.1 hypothetical protein [Bradyrhizobium elkanii]MCP1735132.1 hypothetical protein [Bradyrhizobium elkanii]MCP1752677.1 hypothetical protein [Bradyrhizobium elkanii]MCP1978450.1 hypothetical protein [Bradyrhizobium elkanii]MCS3570473.1 hypothetical protein [Bradyrhizobium elkanii]
MKTIDAFAQLMNAKLGCGRRHHRRGYIRAMIDAVEVGNQAVWIIGDKDILQAAIAGKNGNLRGFVCPSLERGDSSFRRHGLHNGAFCGERRMPWKACKPMDERLKFIARLLDGEQKGSIIVLEYTDEDAAMRAARKIARETGRAVPVRSEDMRVIGSISPPMTHWSKVCLREFSMGERSSGQTLAGQTNSTGTHPWRPLLSRYHRQRQPGAGGRETHLRSRLSRTGSVSCAKNASNLTARLRI